jgi:hypothetical protein
MSERDISGWTRIDGLSMNRDQVIDFYQWLLEEQNFDRVNIHAAKGAFTRERLAASIENWKTNKPDSIARLVLSFADDKDAVLVKMKFT